MKKAILIVLILLAAWVGWYFLRAPAAPEPVTPPISNNPAAASPASDLPDLRLTKPDNSQVSAQTLSGKTVLIVFDPDCDHCQRQAQDMQPHLAAFKDYSVYFVSGAPMAKMQQFLMEYKLGGPNIYYAFTPTGDVLRTLGPISYPSTYIYSEQGKLVKSFNGETPVAQILPVL